MADSIEWDSHQKEIIEATADFKLVAEAGPGTGKTEVACARVASLISTSLEPENILIFSFTRTAVTEIRNRIRDFSGDDKRASGVRITTLDSQVWHLCQGFLEDGAVQELFGSYEANIVTVLEMLRRRSEPLMEHLARYRHVVIDEAQDLVNVRAEFSIELLRCLPQECGISVFADGAQAIYGFTNEVLAAGAGPVRSLLDLIKEDTELSAEFYFTSLDRIYRAGSPGLLKLFNGTRELVKSKEIESINRLEALKSYIAENAGSLPSELSDGKLAEMSQQKMLLLFRRRVEVLLYSSLLYAKKIPHRIRMGNLPEIIKPWIGALFAGYTGPALGAEQFGSLWERKFGVLPDLSALHAPTRDEAWALLKRFARGNNPDLLLVKNLRRVLTRSRPPHEFCLGEAGLGGMTLGTIHASKGREASEVGLMMPKAFAGQESEGDEESRVLYVAATRAKKNLHVGTGFRASGTAYLEGSNRIFRIFDDQSAQVEFGINNDYDPYSVISLRDFPQTANANLLQAELIRNAGSMAEVILRIPADGADFDYRVLMKFEGGSNWFLAGRFQQQVNSDLFSIGKQIKGMGKLRPPAEIKFLQFFSLQTIAIAEDAPNLENMVGSFSDSGFFVAPVIRGFSKVYFRNYMGKFI